MATGNLYTVYPKKENEDRNDNLAIPPRGLYNLGNTCYFNSVMQPLCQTHAFYSKCAEKHPKGDMTYSFKTFCSKMTIGKTKPFDPSEMRNRFINKVGRFDNRRQHDSHECLRHFLDEIRKEERSTKASTAGSDPLTAVDKIFGGHLVTVYICKECDKHYHLFEPCLDISLPVFFEAEKNAERKRKTAETQKDGLAKNDSQTDYKIAVQNLVARLSSKEKEEQNITRTPIYKPVCSQPSSQTYEEIGITRKEDEITKYSQGKRKDQKSTDMKTNTETNVKKHRPDNNVEEARERNSAGENGSNNEESSYLYFIIKHICPDSILNCFGCNEKENPPISNSVEPTEDETEDERSNRELQESNYGEKDFNKSKSKQITNPSHSTETVSNTPQTDANALYQTNPTSSTHQKIAISLYDCLKHFSRVEQIIEEYLCEDCLREAMARGEASEDNLKLTSATKQTLIFNPPAILTIHFKRFELLPGRSRKRSDMVEYPEHLDIAPYCSSQCLRNIPPRNNIWYSLYAVVVHSGSLDFGHYVAYVKVREREKNINELNGFLQQEYFNHNVTSDELIKMINDRKHDLLKPPTKSSMKNSKTKNNAVVPERVESKWYLLNDSSVNEVSLKKVLEQEAYLLFYERVWDAEYNALVAESSDIFNKKSTATKVSQMIETSI